MTRDLEHVQPIRDGNSIPLDFTGDHRWRPRDQMTRTGMTCSLFSSVFLKFFVLALFDKLVQNFLQNTF